MVKYLTAGRAYIIIVAYLSKQFLCEVVCYRYEGCQIRRCINGVIKSAEDKRLYRCLELQNDMKVLLISDSSTDKSAASLDIKVAKL